MLLENDHAKWLRRGRQRAAVVRVLRKPMTASEICRAAQPINPHLQLRDVWFIMGQLKQRGLAVCLNPKHTTGKVYALTEKGRKLAEQAFGAPVARPARGLDWRKYAQVVRAKVRKLVLLELARLPAEAIKTATAIRKRLRDRHPIGLNPTMRALKELERLGLVHSAPVSERDCRKHYRLTKAGAAIARELQRCPRDGL
jgi:DNA-binding PadR family transcriptional regulator